MEDGICSKPLNRSCLNNYSVTKFINIPLRSMAITCGCKMRSRVNDI